MKKLMVSITIIILGVFSFILFTSNANPEATNNKEEVTASNPITTQPISTISESFTITSIDAEGFIHGESTKGTGEGIYYHIDELTAHNVTINEGDTVTIEWAEDNYINEEWDQIESVTVK